MSALEPTPNDRGTLNQALIALGRVEQDLKWIKEALETLQLLCINRGERIQRCEMDMAALDTIIRSSMGHDDRLKALEQGLTQVKTVGGILGTIGGILASIGIRLWGNH